MVTIQQRAIQQAQARVEAQPLTRTQRKRIQLARRTYIPPPPQTPVSAPTPTKTLTWKEEQQQQAQTKLEYYQKKLADARQGDDDEREQRYDSYVAHLSKNMYLIEEGYSYRQVLGLASAWTEYDMAKRDARIQAQRRAEEYERSLEKPEPEEKPSGIFIKPKPTGVIHWIDTRTGYGYSAIKPKSPTDIPASQVIVKRIGDIPFITKRPTPSPPPTPDYTTISGFDLIPEVTATGPRGTLALRPPTPKEAKAISIQKERVKKFETRIEEFELPKTDYGYGILTKEMEMKRKVTPVIKEKITGFETWTTEKLFPSLKEERLKQEELTKETKLLSFQAERFEKAYEGKELPPEEYAEATEILEKLNKDIAQQQKKIKEFQKESTKEKPTDFYKQFGIAFVQTPFEITKTGVGLWGDPSKEITEILKGVYKLPKEFVQAPVIVGGAIAGSIVASTLIFGTGYKITKRIKRPKTPKIKTYKIKPAKIKKTPLSKTFVEKDYITIDTGKPFYKQLEPKVYKQQQVSLRRFQEQQKIQSAVQKKLFRDAVGKEFMQMQRALSKEPRLLALKRFKKKVKAKPKPITYDIEKALLKERLEYQKFRFERGADIVVVDKSGIPRIVQQKIKKKAKPVTVGIDKQTLQLLKEKLGYQKFRFERGADMVVITKEGLPKIIQKKPRFKKKAKPVTVGIDKQTLQLLKEELQYQKSVIPKQPPVPAVRKILLKKYPKIKMPEPFIKGVPVVSYVDLLKKPTTPFAKTFVKPKKIQPTAYEKILGKAGTRRLMTELKELPKVKIQKTIIVEGKPFIGHAFYKDKRILIGKTYKGKPLPKVELKRTLLHEVGHFKMQQVSDKLFDKIFRKEAKITKEIKKTQLYKETKGVGFERTSKTFREFFAEYYQGVKMGEITPTQRKLLRQKYPEIITDFEKLIKVKMGEPIQLIKAPPKVKRIRTYKDLFPEETKLTKQVIQAGKQQQVLLQKVKQKVKQKDVVVKVEDLLKDIDKQIKVQSSLDRFQPLRQFYKTKQIPKTKFGVFAMALPKFLEKEMEAVTQVPRLKEKQVPRLTEKQLLKQIQPEAYPSPVKLTQLFKQPEILKLIEKQMQLTPPPPKIPRLIELEKRKKKLKKKIKKKLFPEFAYIPSFTARAVGLKAVEVSERQAQQLIKKVITGAEIRRPVRIKRKKK